MTEKKRIHYGLPLVASLLMLATPFVFSAAVHANDAPQLSINRSGAKVEMVYNPVQFVGEVADSDGLKQVYGVIRRAGTKHYLAADGSLSKKRAFIPFGFNQGVDKTPWASNPYKLKPGVYKIAVTAVDNQGLSSKPAVMSFRVNAGQNPAGTAPPVQIAPPASNAPQATTSTAPTGTDKLPLVAIQSPNNGSRLKGVVSFQGVAQYAAGITDVVATLADKRTGLYLGPNGKFQSRAQLKMNSQKGKKVRWASPGIQLPAGDYLFAVRSFSGNGKQSNWAKTNFSVVAKASQQNDQQPVINATGGTQAPAAPTPAATSQQTQPAPSGGTAANGMPYCGVGTGSDADGDGFGWENNQSCIVAGSRADTHPNCASAGSDPDGDGYGWENNKSCIVVLHCASGDSDPDGDGFGWENNKSCIVKPTSASSGSHPPCASAASDPDGDGYGWENNKSCIVR